MKRKLSFYLILFLPTYIFGLFWVIPALINAASTVMNLAGFTVMVGLIYWGFYEAMLPFRLNKEEKLRLEARQDYENHLQDEESQLRPLLKEKSE